MQVEDADQLVLALTTSTVTESFTLRTRAGLSACVARLVALRPIDRADVDHHVTRLDEGLEVAGLVGQLTPVSSTSP